jgi:hypothetical protein
VDGFVITAPTKNREEALKISTGLMQKKHKVNLK